MCNAAPAVRHKPTPSLFQRVIRALNNGLRTLSGKEEGRHTLSSLFLLLAAPHTGSTVCAAQEMHRSLDLPAKTLGESKTMTCYIGLFTKLYLVRLCTSRKTRCSKLKTRICLLFTKLSWILSCNRGNTHRAVQFREVVLRLFQSHLYRKCFLKKE